MDDGTEFNCKKCLHNGRKKLHKIEKKNTDGLKSYFPWFFCNKYIGSLDCYLNGNNIISNMRIRPISSKKNLLKYPLKDFYISSSHNSYLAGSQNLDIAKISSIKRCISLGARMIELDIFIDKKTFLPYIAHSKESNNNNTDITTTNRLNFNEVIETIARHAFSDTTDPLFLVLENNNSTGKEEKNNIIHDTLTKHFKGRLMKRLKNKRLINSPMRDLLNKVILLSNDTQFDLGSGYMKLNKIININFGFWFLNKSSNFISNSKYKDKMIRIYPEPGISSNFSYNFDFKPFHDKGCQCVAMNFQKNDKYFKDYLKFFSKSSFVLKPPNLR